MVHMDRQLQETLQRIVEENGERVLLENDGRRAVAFVADYLPCAKKERKLLTNILEEGIVRKIYEEVVVKKQDPTYCRNKYVMRVHEDLCIEQEAAEFIIDCICRVFGLKLQVAEKERSLEGETLEGVLESSEVYEEIIKEHTLFKDLREAMAPSEAYEILKRHTLIGQNAFREYKFASVRIPSNIKLIRRNAFCSSKVTEVYIEGETKLEPGAMNLEDTTMQVTFPSGSEYVCRDGCIVNQRTKTLMGLCAYRLEGKKGNIHVPEGVINIPEGCITYLEGTVYIPDSVENIELMTLEDVEGIEVASGNRKWKSIDGVLYDSQGMTLLKYPACKSGSSVTLPASIQYIGKEAFFGAKYLKNIILGDGLLEIGDMSFFGCHNLKEISGLQQVTRIGRQAFALCIDLNAVELYNKVSEIGKDAFRYCGLEIEEEKDNFWLWVYSNEIVPWGERYMLDDCVYVSDQEPRFSVIVHDNDYVKRYCKNNHIECTEEWECFLDEEW